MDFQKPIGQNVKRVMSEQERYPPTGETSVIDICVHKIILALCTFPGATNLQRVIQKRSGKLQENYFMSRTCYPNQTFA